jgi:hypothetical protein
VGHLICYRVPILVLCVLCRTEPTHAITPTCQGQLHALVPGPYLGHEYPWCVMQEDEGCVMHLPMDKKKEKSGWAGHTCCRGRVWLLLY